MQGRGPYRAVLLAVCFLVFSQVVAAYTVSSITVYPTGSLGGCGSPVPVNVTFAVGNPESDANDFPEAVDMVMFTELDKPVWSLSLMANGGKEQFPEKRSGRVALSDWNLTDFNQNASLEQLMVRLSGYTPRVDRTMNKTVIRISQLDSGNHSITGSNRISLRH